MQQEIRSKLQNIRMFVLDMDGTIYLGDTLFPYTHSFLQAVRDTGRDFCFFTNNSSKNREAYLKKLQSMQISVTPEQMLLSNDVILKWLRANHPEKSAYVVGTPFLLEDFQRNGIVPDAENADYVVLGFDTTLTYEKLSRACTLIREGAPVYGVNADWNCPVPGGFIPDCGSIAALVSASTGVQCEFFGKPSVHTLSYILEHTGSREKEIAVIGDRLYTDISLTENSFVTSILVLSGETKEADLLNSTIKPDVIVENIGALCPFLQP